MAMTLGGAGLSHRCIALDVEEPASPDVKEAADDAKEGTGRTEAVSALPDPPSDERAVLSQFMLARIAENGLGETQAPPPNVVQMIDSLKTRCIQRCESAYKKCGIWFAVREPSDHDAWYAAMSYGVLLHFMPLEELPNYSPDNHKQAVEYYQSWQNKKTGRFYNPYFVDPQNPSVRRHRESGIRYTPDFSKYAISNLYRLKAKPLYPTPSRDSFSDKKPPYENYVDMAVYWQTVKSNASRAGGMCRDLALNIENGRTELIPDAEAAWSYWIRQIDPKSGTLQPMGGTPWHARKWGAYGTTVSLFKIYNRLITGFGLEGIPQRPVDNLVDGLIKGAAANDGPGAMNNTAILSHLMIQYTDYRRDDLLGAMDAKARVWQYPLNPSNYGYTSAVLIPGAYLNWKSEGISRDLCPLVRCYPSAFGATNRYRYHVGPFGCWVNVTLKQPYEVLWHPDYDYRKSGMKSRTKIHWSKQVVDLVAIKPMPLDKNGQGALKFTLTQADVDAMQEPYLKATWRGDFEISVNGVFAKEVRHPLDTPGGLYVAPTAAATLKPGENVVSVKATDPTAQSRKAREGQTISLGLVDWRLAGRSGSEGDKRTVP